jgi:hypothetical protein
MQLGTASTPCESAIAVKGVNFRARFKQASQAKGRWRQVIQSLEIDWTSAVSAIYRITFNPMASFCTM